MSDEAIKYQRGDKVNFLGTQWQGYTGGQKVRLYPNTYVWAIMVHEQMLYVIEHPDGNPKEYFAPNNRNKSNQ